MPFIESYKAWLNGAQIDYDFDPVSAQVDFDLEGDLCDYTLFIALFDDTDTAIYTLFSPFVISRDKLSTIAEYLNYANSYCELCCFFVDPEEETVAARYTNSFATSTLPDELLHTIFESLVAEADAYLEGVEMLLSSDREAYEVFEEVLEKIQSELE